MRNVGSGSFEIKVQRQEEGTDSVTAESVTYIAMAAGSGTEQSATFETFSSSPFDEVWSTQSFGTSHSSPALFAQNMTNAGADVCAVRYDTLTGSSVDILIEEEQSTDAEIGHANETVGFFVIDLGY
tara:strand:- start:223 stop:603 length:381 start_codon:yes stop_codon:yes gene_type:complete